MNLFESLLKAWISGFTGVIKLRRCAICRRQLHRDCPSSICHQQCKGPPLSGNYEKQELLESLKN